MSVLVLYTDYDYCIYESFLETFKDILPEAIKEQAYKIRRWEDRQAFLLGKLLVWKGLREYRYTNDCLHKLWKNQFGKPYIDSNVFFNLSHSGRYVICAFHTEEIGIDIENICNIDIDDFISFFSAQEITCLKSSTTPLKDFFRLMTLKESVVKAAGKGISIPLHLVNALHKGTMQYGEEKWFVKEISGFENCYCSLAGYKELPDLILEKVDFEQLKP